MKGIAVSRGFTLIELIGVMAIIAILAATIAPSIIRDIDRAVGESEQENLKSLASDLTTYALNNKIIPSASTWQNAIASISDIPADKIRENRRFYNRSYYVDPRFFTNSDMVFSGYNQTNGLGSQPVSPRIIIASNLKGTLPLSITSSANFEAVWNQTAGSPIVEGPDLKIQRVNLQGLFHRVLFANSNMVDSPGYRLENGTVQSISSSTVELYVLKDTKISLIDGPFTSNILSRTFLVSGATSYSYNNGAGTWQWVKL